MVYQFREEGFLITLGPGEMSSSLLQAMCFARDTPTWSTNRYI